MPADPLTFAIVTPSFNQGPYLEATIRSVLVQNYPHVQYVVMDACSTDSTPAVLERYRDKVEVVVEPDEGQTDAINKGFARTTAQILGWLNSDDVLHPGALSAVAEIFEAQPDVALVYGDADFIDAQGKFIARCAHIEPFNHDRLLNYSDYIVQPAAFFRRDAFDAVGGLDKSLNWAMDYDLWLKLAQRYRAVYVPKMLASYRWFGENKTATGSYLRLREVEGVARKHGSATLPAYFRLEKVNLHLQDMRRHLRDGQVGSAITHFGRACCSVLGSRRAIAAALSPQTWRVIATGKQLRAHERTTP